MRRMEALNPTRNGPRHTRTPTRRIKLVRESGTVTEKPGMWMVRRRAWY